MIPQLLPFLHSLVGHPDSMDVTSRLRQQAPLQLPTVCVSMESSGALPPRPIPVMGTPSPIASESTSPIPTGGLFNSDLSVRIPFRTAALPVVSLKPRSSFLRQSLLHTSSTVMFSDAAFLPLGATSLPTLSTFEIEYFKFLADHPHLLRSETAGATSAMQVQSCDKWLSYREERTRSSSSDSGVTSQFSPPNLLSLGTDSVFGDAIPPSTSPDTKTLEESLLRIRTVSESFEQLDEFSDEIKQPIAKKPLERKTSVIHPTPTRPIPQKGNVFRSESLPVRFPTIVEAADPELNVNNVNMLLHLQTVQRLFNNNLFIPAVAASGILPVHSKSVSPLPPFDAPKPAVPLEEYSPDGKRQYICRVCNKDFKRPDILSRHLRRHTGEKPFHCEDCGRFFSRSDHLRTHQRTHTDEKPYKCDHCPYAARRRDVLTRHMSTRHQAKAGKSVFQRHRTVRRCVSDGDVSLATVQKEPQEGLTPVELIVARSSPFAKRERHTTEVATPTQPLIHAPRARHVTEIPSTSKDDFEENSTTDVDDDELEDDDFDDVGSVIDVTKIEDDVIVDMEPMCEDEQS
ncbi:hypothetical protein QR680_008854 [Steinernema hermaphroditum]|uniref:C2H2-type domain-containing protein n=1 Tax=Steinernema hermaphroditum TaxID=289476 RepID=A0AA39M8U4_9BILA|nr:hypothetical protein QR680_008854 [Steinernema hermaphroditum]